MNLYDVLCTDRSATLIELRKCYHALALKFHPDKHGENETMIRVQHAWEILRDPVSRAEYDSKLRADEAWAGQCEQYYAEDMIFKASKAVVECRCGTLVSLMRDSFLNGFSRVQCQGCSLRIEFQCQLSDFLE